MSEFGKGISQKTREQRIKNFVASIKYLYEPKYYKTNKVSCAAFDSWAARGQAGGCRLCNVGHYNFTIHNRRKTNPYKSWSSNKVANLCSDCYYEIEKQVKYEFEKY